jgi:hypothetical protein
MRPPVFVGGTGRNRGGRGHAGLRGRPAGAAIARPGDAPVLAGFRGIRSRVEDCCVATAASATLSERGPPIFDSLGLRVAENNHQNQLDARLFPPQRMFHFEPRSPCLPIPRAVARSSAAAFLRIYDTRDDFFATTARIAWSAIRRCGNVTARAASGHPRSAICTLTGGLS